MNELAARSRSTIGNDIARVLLIACVVFLTTGAVVLRADPEEDSDIWTRLEIKEAFVSRATTLANRDGFGAPEFGWHIKEGSMYLGGGTLYATIYYPRSPDARVDLLLMERDLIASDLVSRVQLQPGAARIEMNGNGDFAIIERTAIQPDRSSGGDARPDGARLLTGDHADSVSFAAGDFTDYHRLPAGTIALIVKDGMRGDVDAPGSLVRHYPDSLLLQRVLLAVTDESGDVIRVRGPIGGQRIDYRLYPTRANATVALEKTLTVVARDPAFDSYFYFTDAVESWTDYDKETTLAVCRTRLTALRSDRARTFCALALYRAGSDTDTARLDQRFANESEFYRETLRRYRPD